MARFYHLDRGNKLEVGQSIDLVKINDINCRDNPMFTQTLQSHFYNLFPNGVTSHGDGYFASSSEYAIISPAIELLYEYVRKANFKDKPSRAESFFAVKSLNDIQRFADMYRINIYECSIWEVECENYHRGDMNLLKILPSNLITSYFANEYWSGGTADDPQPFWEYLLTTPVKIVRKINLMEELSKRL